MLCPPLLASSSCSSVLARARRLAFTPLFALACLLAPRPLAAQAPPPPAANQARSLQRRSEQLRIGIEELARLGSASQLYGSIGSIVVGGLSTAYGVSVALDHEALGRTADRAALSGVALSAGAVMIARGVYNLLSPDNTDADRLERFKLESSRGPLDAEALARFEGELAAEAQLAHVQRIGGGVSAFALAAAGGTLIAFGATSKLEGSAESAAFIAGGTFLGLGLLQGAAALFIPSPHERVWQNYEGMRMADASSLVRISLAPAVGPKTLAFRLVGQF